MDYLFFALLAGGLACGPFWAYDRWVYSKKRVIFGSTPWGIKRLAPWFPMLACACAVKAFALEPFQIPSISMRPTLAPGSMVVASKWDYNVWLPFEPAPRWRTFEPRRGEVAMFIYPVDGKTVFVKRIIGLPGDEIGVDEDGAVWINGDPLRRKLAHSCASSPEPSERGVCHEEWRESWGEASWSVLRQSDRAALGARPEASMDGCAKSGGTGRLVCRVPAGSYFMLGDNRDDSLDSRYWGSVPRDHLMGRALVAFAFSSLSTSGMVR